MAPTRRTAGMSTLGDISASRPAGRARALDGVVIEWRYHAGRGLWCG